MVINSKQFFKYLHLELLVRKSDRNYSEDIQEESFIIEINSTDSNSPLDMIETRNNLDFHDK